MPIRARANTQIIAAVNNMYSKYSCRQAREWLEGRSRRRNHFFRLYTTQLQEKLGSTEGGDPAVGWVVYRPDDIVVFTSTIKGTKLFV